MAENPQNNHLRVVAAAETQEIAPMAAKLLEELSEDGTERTATYLFHHPAGSGEVAALSDETLGLITEKADAYVICADVCYLSETEMDEFHISFRKMPRDWALLPAAIQDKIRELKPEYEVAAGESIIGQIREEMSRRGYAVSDELIIESTIHS